MTIYRIKRFNAPGEIQKKPVIPGQRSQSSGKQQSQGPLQPKPISQAQQLNIMLRQQGNAISQTNTTLRALSNQMRAQSNAIKMAQLEQQKKQLTLKGQLQAKAIENKINGPKRIIGPYRRLTSVVLPKSIK